MRKCTNTIQMTEAVYILSISCMQINGEIGVNKNKISNWFQYYFFTLIVYNTPLFVQRLQKKTKVSSIQEK